MIEVVTNRTLSLALTQKSDEPVPVTDAMYEEAGKAVLGAEKCRVGFVA